VQHRHGGTTDWAKGPTEYSLEEEWWEGEVQREASFQLGLESERNRLKREVHTPWTANYTVSPRSRENRKFPFSTGGAKGGPQRKRVSSLGVKKKQEGRRCELGGAGGGARIQRREEGKTTIVVKKLT